MSTSLSKNLLLLFEIYYNQYHYQKLKILNHINIHCFLGGIDYNLLLLNIKISTLLSKKSTFLQVM